MRLAIGLALLVLAVSLLTIMVVVLRMASRMGDETPGWARVHRHLPIGRQRRGPSYHRGGSTIPVAKEALSPETVHTSGRSGAGWDAG
jgi:hypothetical protein